MNRFVYCLNSSTIMPTPLLRKIDIAGEAGYEAIELWHSDIDVYLASGGTLADLRKALADAGLKVPTTIFLKGWWDTVGSVYDQAMDEVQRRLEQAAAVGATHSIAGPPLGPVDLAVGASQYARLLELGRQFGVRPAFEYLGFSQDVNTIAVALDVITRSGDSDATIVLDSFHCFRGSGGLETISHLEASQIAVAHFNDAPDFPPRHLQHDPDRVMPGDGVIDLKRYCSLLEQVGYDQCLSLELFNREYWGMDPAEVVRVGLDKMRQLAQS